MVFKCLIAFNHIENNQKVYGYRMSTPLYNFSVHLNLLSYTLNNILFHLSYLSVFKLDKGQLT